MNYSFYGLVCFFLLNVVYAGQADDWLRLKKEVGSSAVLSTSQIGGLQISGNDSEQECVKKLLTLSKTVWEKPSSDAMRKMVHLCEQAHKLHPGSAALTSYYVIYKHIVLEIKPGDCILLLLPFFQETERCPFVPYAMWYIMESLRRNYQGGDVSQLFSGIQPEEVLRRLQLLEKYWLSKNDFRISDDRFALKIQEAQTFFEKNGISDVLNIWREVVDNSIAIKVSIREVAFAKKFMDDFEKERMAERNRRLSLQSDNRRLSWENGVKKLDSFCSKPNSLEKIQQTLAPLRTFRDELKVNDDIPNLEKLKKLYPNDNETEILNIAYKVYLLRDFENALKMINVLSRQNPDLRLSLMKVYCLQQLRRSEREIIAALDEVLKINPKHMQSIMIKGALEAKLNSMKEQ